MTRPSPEPQKNNPPYPSVDSNPDLPKIEERVLDYWRKDKTFEKSLKPVMREQEASASPERGFIGELENSPGNQQTKQFIFYDGPPFANGLPHYGHLLTGYVKDIFARYQTMKGKKVERRFGWDCHGLPAEMGAEKELNIAGRQQIEKFGIDKFNAHCRESVMKYTHEWEYYVTRQARWVDFKNDYKTMDISYMESVMWAFKTLYDKGLVYESHRVMPYSWAMETPLSNFETRMDNSYRERTDKAVTVAFKLNTPPKGAPEAKEYYVLAWTTTPWTLPSNLALGVSEEMQYVYLAHKEPGKCYIMSAKTAGSVTPPMAINMNMVPGTDLTEIPIKGSDLVGLSYTPLFPYFKAHEHAFKILAADFIEEGSGTGIVHLAPGFGEDDQRVCEANGIELICPVDERGRYTDEIFDLPSPQPSPASGRGSATEESSPSGRGQGEGLSLKGLNVVADKNKNSDEPYKPEQLEKYGLANLRIIDYLKKTGALIHQEDFKHNYPHCWRTDTPLIYRALPSWYVEVTKFNKRMVELNQQINWIPEHIKEGRFGKWLEGARDWSISRNRYWGCPIPIWRSKSGKLKVFGSIAELEKASGKKITDLHRPFIDQIIIEEGGEEFTRVPDVLDCWFESGAMPFAQVHYPFENKDWFETHFPADFIVEYEAQTRGWFYTLMVLGTALFDKPPFKNCICHGVVLDDKGQKLSKSKGNYVDPKEIFQEYGADALRWLMCSSPIMHGHELYIDKEGKFIRDVVRLYIKPIWNAYNFFTLYANADGIKAEFKTDSTNLMDRYILAKLSAAVSGLEKYMDAFDTPNSYKEIEQFFEVLNNWYIRRNKERFWKSEKDADKQAAYDTLYTVLVTMMRAIAPLLPLISEEIYRGLTGEESVHLVEFPSINEPEGEGIHNEGWSTQSVIHLMDLTRSVCNAALAIRNKANIRVRQPLKKLTAVGNKMNLLGEDSYFGKIIADEINVKEIISDPKGLEDVSDLKISINNPVLARRLPEKMKQILPASKKGEWEKLSETQIKICGEVINLGEFIWQLEPKPEYKDSAQALSTNDALVILDLTITPELEMEGIARDVVRFIQQSRKDANLNIADRIAVSIKSGEKIEAAIKANREYIMDQVLAATLESGATEGKHKFKSELDEGEIALGFSVV